MTPTEKNIACAELDGWKPIVEVMDLWAAPNGVVGDIPDYVKDLNACAGLVAKLTKRQVALYHLSLLAMCNGRSTAIDATAPQRVEAILRATRKRKDA